MAKATKMGNHVSNTHATTKASVTSLPRRTTKLNPRSGASDHRMPSNTAVVEMTKPVCKSTTSFFVAARLPRNMGRNNTNTQRCKHRWDQYHDTYMGRQTSEAHLGALSKCAPYARPMLPERNTNETGDTQHMAHTRNMGSPRTPAWLLPWLNQAHACTGSAKRCNPPTQNAPARNGQ